AVLRFGNAAHAEHGVRCQASLTGQQNRCAGDSESKNSCTVHQVTFRRHALITAAISTLPHDPDSAPGPNPELRAAGHNRSLLVAPPETARRITCRHPGFRPDRAPESIRPSVNSSGR